MRKTIDDWYGKGRVYSLLVTLTTEAILLKLYHGTENVSVVDEQKVLNHKIVRIKTIPAFLTIRSYQYGIKQKRQKIEDQNITDKSVIGSKIIRQCSNNIVILFENTCQPFTADTFSCNSQSGVLNPTERMQNNRWFDGTASFFGWLFFAEIG